MIKSCFIMKLVGALDASILSKPWGCRCLMGKLQEPLASCFHTIVNIFFFICCCCYLPIFCSLFYSYHIDQQEINLYCVISICFYDDLHDLFYFA